MITFFLVLDKECIDFSDNNHNIQILDISFFSFSICIFIYFCEQCITFANHDVNRFLEDFKALQCTVWLNVNWNKNKWNQQIAMDPGRNICFPLIQNILQIITRATLTMKILEHKDYELLTYDMIRLPGKFNRVLDAIILKHIPRACIIPCINYFCHLLPWNNTKDNYIPGNFATINGKKKKNQLFTLKFNLEGLIKKLRRWSVPLTFCQYKFLSIISSFS